MSQSLGYKLVDYKQGAELQIGTELKGKTGENVGATHAEVVQLVSGLAVMHDAVTSHGKRVVAGDDRLLAAVWTGEGKVSATFDAVPAGATFQGIRPVGTEERREIIKKGGAVLAVVGNGELVLPTEEKAPLGEDWARSLALACDHAIGVVKDLKQGPQAPVRPMEAAPIVLPAVGIVVVGAAVSVIGAVSAWRYFDPDARAKVAAITEAAAGYKMRLEVLKNTGTMPPPSGVEEANAELVKKMAGEERTSGWVWAGAVAGGVAAATLGIAAWRRYAA